MSEYVVDPSALVAGNRITLLRDSTEAYPLMLDSIRHASHSVLVEMYIFASDEVGWAFARELAERARAGIQVRVLYDALGSNESSTEMWSHLRLAGAAVTPYRPLGWFSFRNRDHRKLIVVDGRKAYAGGLNITGQQTTHWRDTHLEIEGPVVADLVRLFAQTWEREEDDPLWRPKPPEPPAVAGTVSAAVFNGNRWLDRRSIGAAYIHAIKRARKRIWISNAYFMPGIRFLRALRRAARRSVDVRVLVPRVTDVWPVYYASRSLFRSLLTRRIRIFEYLGPMFHAKTAVIDGLWSTVGSYNLDHLSLVRNLELSLVIEDTGIGAGLEEMFEEDLRRSEEVKLETWQKRPWSQAALEWFWRLFQSTL